MFIFWRTSGLFTCWCYRLEYVFFFSCPKMTSWRGALLILCYVYVHMPGYSTFINFGKLIFSNQGTCLSNLPWIGTLDFCVIPCLECFSCTVFTLLNLNHPRGLSSNLCSFGNSPTAVSPGSGLFLLQSFSQWICTRCSLLVRHWLGNRSYATVVCNK